MSCRAGQRGHLPIGSLKDAAAYPADATGIHDSEVVGALEAVGLGRLAEAGLLEADVTSLGLSGG